MLRANIATIRILQHFDPDRILVIVVYASKWAVSASLRQEYDDVYWSVTFLSRTLKSNKINYSMVKKEVLALLKILDVCYVMLVERSKSSLGIQPWFGWSNLRVLKRGWGDGPRCC